MGLRQAQHRGRVGRSLGEPFAGLGMGDLHGTVGVLAGGLGELFGFGARVGHGFIGLLTGRQHRVEGTHRRPRQTRLHIDPHHFDTQPLPCRRQVSQASVKPLHQIATQAFAALGRLVVATHQFGASHQNGVQIPGCSQGHGTAGRQPVQCRQDMFTLQDEGIRVGDFVEHPHIQLHHAGITGQ